MIPGDMVIDSLTRLGPWVARFALAAWLLQVEDPLWTAACLAVFAAQFPIQRAILAWDIRGRAPAAAGVD